MSGSDALENLPICIVGDIINGAIDNNHFCNTIRYRSIDFVLGQYPHLIGIFQCHLQISNGHIAGIWDNNTESKNEN